MTDKQWPKCQTTAPETTLLRHDGTPDEVFCGPTARCRHLTQTEQLRMPAVEYTRADIAEARIAELEEQLDVALSERDDANDQLARVLPSETRLREERDALQIIAESVAAALERNGITDVDDPGESIDVIADERDALHRRIDEAPTESGDILNIRAYAPESFRGKRYALVVLP